MEKVHARWHEHGHGWPFSVDARDLLHGALSVTPTEDGWWRPSRFTPAQERALASCAAWHPSLYRQMAQATSGIVVEFVTDAEEVALEVKVDREPQGTTAQRLLAFGEDGLVHDGFSFEVDGIHGDPVMPPVGRPVEVVCDLSVHNPGTTKNLPGLAPLHHGRIWLPALRGCEVRGLCADGHTVVPVAPRPVFLALGDSITQGFIVDDPAATWPALVAQAMDMDLVNQGVGGQVFQPSALAGLPQAVDPQVVWVALGTNYRFEPSSVREVSRDITDYLQRVRRAWPEASFYVATTPFFDPVAYPSHNRSCIGEVDRLIAQAVEGLEGVELVDGRDLMDPAESLRVDADHPSSRGAAQISQRVLRVLDGMDPRPRPQAPSPARHHRGPKDAGLPPETDGPQLTMAFDVDGLGEDGEEPIQPIAASPVASPAQAPKIPETAGPHHPEEARAPHPGATPAHIRALIAMLSRQGLQAIPAAEALRRGLGRLVHGDQDLVVIDFPGGERLLWGVDTPGARRTLERLSRPTVAVVTTRELVGAAHGAWPGAADPQWCSMAAYQSTVPVTLRGLLAVEPLGPGAAALLEETYSHPEYFTHGEWVRKLAEAKILGGTDAEGELVGYVGVHEEGSMGMLEVFDGFRRRGYGFELEGTLINRQLRRGWIPWAQVFPENHPSAALQEKLGLTMVDRSQAYLEFS